MNPSPFLRRRRAGPFSLICAAALAACGGGEGSSGDNTSASVTPTETATAYAANATQLSNDATTALDASLAAAQAVVQAGALASAPLLASGATDDRATRLSISGATAQPSAVGTVPVNCPGGGSASLSITGGTPISILNGKLDAGEIYQLAFTDCRGATGAAAINGALALTVNAANASTLSVALVADNLVIALPKGIVTINGSAAEQLSSTALPSGSTRQTSQFTASSLTVVTQFNARSSSFTLSDVALSNQIDSLNGVVQSSSVNGTHTLAANLPRGSFNYSVSTQGSVSYSTTGVPTAGSWQITQPTTLVGVAIAGGVATITVDDGKDGSIDKTFTVPVSLLQSELG